MTSHAGESMSFPLHHYCEATKPIGAVEDHTRMHTKPSTQITINEISTNIEIRKELASNF
jgi:hypothetical protein